MASVLSRVFLRRNDAASEQAVQHKSTTSLYANWPASYMHTPGQAVWMRRDYGRFADEAYVKNVIAHRSIELVARSVATVPLRLLERDAVGMRTLNAHPLLSLIRHPNPLCSGTEFLHALVAHKLIAGNAYVLATGPANDAPRELHLLRPDRVAVIAGEGGIPKGYQHKVGSRLQNFPVDAITGQSRVLHLRQFHPRDDWYGLSSVEPAAYSIDQHNQSAAWNQALMQNGARPSGALVVNVKERGGHLSEEQYYRIKQQIDEQFTGTGNAGRPILLEGGLEWKDMSHSPRDMDFIQSKHSAARDIALAFGVPPQLLGIPGDNTYSNLAEARLALWEQTIVPTLTEVLACLNHWLVPMFDSGLELRADYDDVPALSLRRDALWARIKDADFLSDEEKRRILGVD